MDSIFSSSAAIAAASADAPSNTEASIAAGVVAAAKLLLGELERGRLIDSPTLRTAMTAGFGGSDAEGRWGWKTAYDACEAAQVLFLRKFGPAMRARAGSPPALLPMLAKIAALLPSHTRRSEESQALQQFSTPITLGFVASIAAAMTTADLVLEPSAGTGLLAIFTELAGAGVVLNELADTRAEVLARLFPGPPVTRHDAAYIHDYLDTVVRPSIVLMNPPFSVAANVDGRVADAALRHISSALARLADRGRLVAITGASLSPDNPTWHDAFVTLQQRGRFVFTAAIDGGVYARHGTTTDTRLTVIDRVPADDPAVFPPSPGVASDTATLLDWVTRLVPPRPAIAPMASTGRTFGPAAVRTPSIRPAGHVRGPVLPVMAVEPTGVELSYEVSDWAPAETGRLTEALYEPYTLQSIRIPGSKPHPTRLVQSAAMASVAPPKPSYRPHLPPNLVSDGLLSDAQLESVIHAGEAHCGYLAGSWTVDDTFDVVSAAPDDAEDAVRFRRGWFLGDGTGAGKGRQVAGILLDNWLKGQHRAVWVSKSDKLIEDAQRDWSALGQERLLIVPLARFRQGTPIRLSQGVLFTTYATLRSDAREERVSRVRQIVDWLGRDFDGVIVFDESHAMQNAAGQTSERGDQAPSQQGRAGLRLQHALPNARVLYVSATGATTVHNLAYAQRLGLWGGADFPFATRAEFVQAIEAGGVAAMEVLARDLKALGLYAARSLSYEGIEYELIEHQLTPEQVRIYDAYAGAFQVIHNNLAAALQATNVTGESGTLNRQAKSAARSAFESAKQRFFNHLITAMKTPALIAAVERFLRALVARPSRSRGGTLSASSRHAYALVILSLYLQRRKLANPPPEHPFAAERPSVVSGHTHDSRASLPYTPDAIAVPLLSAALRLIGRPADDVIALRDQVAPFYEQRHAKGFGNRRLRAAVLAVIDNFSFSTIAGEESPWHPKIRGTKRLRFLMERIYEACFVTIAYLVGARVSEILALEAGCVERRPAADGCEDFSYLRGRIFKTATHDVGEPHLWAAPPPVLRAINVLDRSIQ